MVSYSVWQKGDNEDPAMQIDHSSPLGFGRSSLIENVYKALIIKCFPKVNERKLDMNILWED